MKFKIVTLVFTSVLCLSDGIPSKALPGQKLSDSYNHPSNLFGGREIQPTQHYESGLGDKLKLHSTRRFKANGIPIEEETADLHKWVSPEDKIIFESIASGKNGQKASQNLLNDLYNPRSDSNILSVVKPIWGNKVAHDFSKSRFTNSFIYKDPRSSHVGIRRIYVGKTYIHEIIGGKGNRYTVGFLYNIYLNEKSILKRLRQAEDFESRQ